jgi:hypothetical protein
MLKLAAAIFSLAMLAAAAPASAVPTIAAHTKVVVFNAKSMHVTGRETGYCWTSSIASQRGDAYRCMVGNGIHDPCFMLSQRSVACPADPAANTGVVISLTKPLPAQHSVANAWQMQLSSGAMCNMGTGTIVPGYPFYCSGGNGLVCSGPPVGQPDGPVFVRCASAKNGKIGAPGTYLVTTLYE